MKSNRYTLHPATLYLLLTAVIVFASWLLDVYGLSCVVPGTGEVVSVRSILSPGGIRWLLRHVVTNFTGFAPLGMVLVAMLGIGTAYYTGLLEAAIRASARYISQRGVLWVIILSGVLSNVIGDSGYIVLIPIASLLSKSVGLHPVVGVIVAFVSVACGYSANIVMSTMDPMMARITADAAAGCSADCSGVGVLGNWLFMGLSTVPVAVTIYLVTQKWLIRRVGSFQRLTLEPLTQKERRALFGALQVGVAYLVLVLVTTFSGYGILRGVSGNLMRSPFIFGILFIISMGFLLMGLVYGLTTGALRSDRALMAVMVKSMRFVAPFIVIAFFAAQMFACFQYSHLDRFIVSSLASLGSGWQIGVIPQLLLFVLLVSVANLFMVSATTKWSIMAYAFVPLFASMDVAPEFVQCAFRVGDSLTNAVTPFMFYMPLLYIYLEKYKMNVSFFTIGKYTWVYTFWLGIVWISLLFVWFLCGLSTGI